MSRRCAIYTRYSSDMQREASIEDQERRCREYAQQQAWSVVEEHVVADRAISGASVAGRSNFLRLMEAAKRKQRSFDTLLIYDTGRFSRDLPDLLRNIDILKYHGVNVLSVAEGIDSAQPTGRQMFALQGMHAEQFLDSLRDKVHRGQEGRMLKGLNPGGRIYGYDNVPIEDPTRTGKYGRPAVSGVKLEINPALAAVINRIFTMYTGGMGQGAIAIQLNRGGVAGPKGHWSRYTIHEMLRNERYRGVFVWGRTKKDRNPETGKKISRPTLESGWRRVEVPAWRIVPEELWRAVEERRKLAGERLHQLGGMTRTERGKSYLFSGTLACGECGGSMVICAGGGKRGYVKYGCHAKEALAKHIGKLVLTPVQRDGRPVYKVSGNVSVQPDSEKCRMLVVARDGIEPPTPAFSGLRSTS